MGMIFISATTSALQSQDAKSALSQQKLEKIHRYLEYKEVPLALCSKILEYYEYQMTSSVTLAQMVEFKELPSSMHTQLTMELNRNVLKKCHLWAMLPWEVVIALMAELTPIVFPPNHDIVKQGEISPGLHFIEQGRVRVLKKEKAEVAEDQEMKEVAVLGGAQYFGESSLLAILRRLIDDQENIKAASERCAARFGAEEDGMAQATVRTEGFCDMLVLGISAFKHVVATHEAMLNSLDQIEEALAQNWIEPSPKMRKSRICSRLCHSTSLDKGSGLCSRIKGVLRDGSSVSTCSRSSSAKKVFSETADDSDREDGDSRSTLDGAINSNDPIAEPYPPKNHSKTNGTPGKEQHDQEAMIVEPAIMTVERAVPMFAQSVIVESSGSDPVTSILAAAGKSSALFDVGGPFGSLEKAHVISIEKVPSTLGSSAGLSRLGGTELPSVSETAPFGSCGAAASFPRVEAAQRRSRMDTAQSQITPLPLRNSQEELRPQPPPLPHGQQNSPIASQHRAGVCVEGEKLGPHQSLGRSSKSVTMCAADRATQSDWA